MHSKANERISLQLGFLIVFECPQIQGINPRQTRDKVGRQLGTRYNLFWQLPFICQRPFKCH